MRCCQASIYNIIICWTSKDEKTSEYNAIRTYHIMAPSLVLAIFIGKLDRQLKGGMNESHIQRSKMTIKMEAKKH
jgi:hypothetical protein